MGLLDGTTQGAYYQGNDLGNYQFISLNDIVNQFLIMYVGEDKILPKIKRADVAFHAHRALAELSFDTFKSFKSQQIDIPPSLTMMLPHDYVNYTKVSWTDAAGIKHPIYPTKHTSNPFQVKQNDDGSYVFEEGTENLIINGNFSSTDKLSFGWQGLSGSVEDGVMKFIHQSHTFSNGQVGSKVQYIFQPVDVSDIDFITLSADGVANVASGTGTSAIPNGILRFGLTSTNMTGLPPGASLPIGQV